MKYLDCNGKAHEKWFNMIKEDINSKIIQPLIFKKSKPFPSTIMSIDKYDELKSKDISEYINTDNSDKNNGKVKVTIDHDNNKLILEDENGNIVESGDLNKHRFDAIRDVFDHIDDIIENDMNE